MGHQDPWSSRNPAPGPLSHLRAPILVTRPGVTELVTRHTVRSAREFALNLPMALFFILLVLLLFACIFPLLASCCLIQNCSDTASLPHPAPANKTNPPFKQQQTQIQCDGGAWLERTSTSDFTGYKPPPAPLQGDSAGRDGLAQLLPEPWICQQHLSMFLMQLQCRERSWGRGMLTGHTCPAPPAVFSTLGTLGLQWEQARSKSRQRLPGFCRSHHGEPCSQQGLCLWQQKGQAK